MGPGPYWQSLVYTNLNKCGNYSESDDFNPFANVACSGLKKCSAPLSFSHFATLRPQIFPIGILCERLTQSDTQSGLYGSLANS